MPDNYTNFPNGLTSFGIPLPSAMSYDAPSLFGTQWFVNTVTGADGNDGRSPLTPFKTMGRALAFSDGSANVGPNDTIWFVGTVREQLVAPLTKTIAGTARAVTGVSICGMPGGNVRDDDGAKWTTPVSGAVVGRALIEIRQQGWEFHNFLMTPQATGGACIKAHRNEDATYPDSSHFVVNRMRFVGAGGTPVGIEDVGGNHHYIIQNSEFQTLTFAITCTSTGIAVPLRNTIRCNKFMGNTNDIATSLTDSAIQNNIFFTAGAGAVNKVVSTTYNAAQGGGNMVLLNQFNNTEVQIAPGSGFTGAATDVWMNYVNNQAALAFGQPA